MSQLSLSTHGCLRQDQRVVEFCMLKRQYTIRSRYSKGYVANKRIRIKCTRWCMRQSLKMKTRIKFLFIIVLEDNEGGPMRNEYLSRIRPDALSMLHQKNVHQGCPVVPHKTREQCSSASGTRASTVPKAQLFCLYRVEHTQHATELQLWKDKEASSAVTSSQRCGMNLYAYLWMLKGNKAKVYGNQRDYMRQSLK